MFAPLVATTVTTFPNPAVKSLFIDLRQPVRDARVIVYDPAGRELLRREGVTATVVELDVSELPKGSYLLRVEDGGKLFTGKFQK
ncbi:T9SS type A sorting domain-containing protein [Neolewinella sp.]|uniref:T9SS type A sorting domain-containing protein n=1 Tax=Neolewinella sp. TaxID=2993543 RepID=UPI003B52DA7E